jgi:hypothetical protein
MLLLGVLKVVICLWRSLGAVISDSSLDPVEAYADTHNKKKGDWTAWEMA